MTCHAGLAVADRRPGGTEPLATAKHLVLSPPSAHDLPELGRRRFAAHPLLSQVHIRLPQYAMAAGSATWMTTILQHGSRREGEWTETCEVQPQVVILARPCTVVEAAGALVRRPARARPARGAETPARQWRGPASSVHARGAVGRSAPASQHRHRLRRRRPRRPAVYRHGVHRWRHAGDADPGRRAVFGDPQARHHRRGGRRPGLRAPARHHPSGHQAGQPDDVAGRAREGARFRHRPGLASRFRRNRRADAHRHARLHGPGAARGRRRSTPAATSTPSGSSCTSSSRAAAPFRGQPRPTCCRRSSTRSRSRSSDLVPDIDPDLCKVIGRAMARQPARSIPGPAGDAQGPGARPPPRHAGQRRRRDHRRRAAGDQACRAGSRQRRGAVPSTVVPPPTPPPQSPPTSAPSVASPPTAADRGLAHLAAQRASTTRPVTAVVGRDRSTRRSPLSAVPPATAPLSAPPPTPVSRSGPGPVGHRSPRTATAVAESRALLSGRVAARGVTSPVDDGPLPVPLPAVPSSGIYPIPTAGRATVDAPVIAEARDRSEWRRPPAPAADADAKPASPPRMPIAAAPPPVAAPGVVQASPAPGALTPRRGIPAAVIVGALVAMLAVCFIAAFFAVRSFGLLTGSPLSGLLTRTVEPKVTNPPPLDAPVEPEKSPTESTRSRPPQRRHPEPKSPWHRPWSRR